MKSDSVTAVKRAVVALLQTAAFEEALQGVEVELGVQVPRPRQFYTHELTRPPDAFPAVEVATPRSEIDRETDAHSYRHHLLVTWTFIGDDETHVVEWVEAALLASRRLLFRALLDLDGTEVPIIPQGESYTMLTRARNLPATLIKAGVLELIVPTVG